MREDVTRYEVARNPSASLVLVAVAREHGLSARACLAGSGLDESTLQEPELEIDAGQELTVIRNLVHHTRNRPGIGAQAGSRVTLGMLGIWGLALLLSRSVRDMNEIALRYGYRKFSWELLRPQIEERDTECRICYDPIDLPDDLIDFLIERDIAYTSTLVPMLIGRRAPFRTETTLDPARGQVLAALFPGHDFRFNCERNAQILDLKTLDAPLPQADPIAVRMCERQCEELLASRTRRTGVAASVRSALLRLGPRRPSLRELAAERHVDPRTLRRQLEAEGTSFRELADEVGRTLAVELLTAAGLTVEQVADRLGYADAASLTRAFKRWTGHTPGSLTRNPSEWTRPNRPRPADAGAEREQGAKLQAGAAAVLAVAK